MVERGSPASRSGKPSGQMDALSACAKVVGGSNGPKDLSLTVLSKRAILQANYTIMQFLGQCW